MSYATEQDIIDWLDDQIITNPNHDEASARQEMEDALEPLISAALAARMPNI